MRLGCTGLQGGSYNPNNLAFVIQQEQPYFFLLGQDYLTGCFHVLSALDLERKGSHVKRVHLCGIM